MNRLNESDENMQRCHDEVTSATEKTLADLRPKILKKYHLDERGANAAMGLAVIRAGCKQSILHYNLSETHINLLTSIINQTVCDYLVGAGVMENDEDNNG